MGTEHTILFLSGLLLLAIIVQPLARKIHLPFTATLVVAGFIASELLVMAGIDTGVRAESFHDLIVTKSLQIKRYITKAKVMKFFSRIFFRKC